VLKSELFIPRPGTTFHWVIDLLASLRLNRDLRVTKSHKIRIDRGEIREVAKYSSREKPGPDPIFSIDFS